MSYEQAMGFFIISVMLIGSALVTFAAVNAVAKYREKKAKEHKELEEARKMFEQRIALKPKRMENRHAFGAAPVHFGEIDKDETP